MNDKKTIDMIDKKTEDRRKYCNLCGRNIGIRSRGGICDVCKTAYQRGAEDERSKLFEEKTVDMLIDGVDGASKIIKKLESSLQIANNVIAKLDNERTELRKEVEELRKCHESELGVCYLWCDRVNKLKKEIAKHKMSRDTNLERTELWKARWEKLKEIEGKLLFTAECLESHVKREGCKGVFHWINNSASLIREYVKEMRELEKEEKK